MAIVRNYNLTPTNDWTILIGGWRFGLLEWGNSNCAICLGRYSFDLPFSAPVVAGGLSLLLLLLLFAGWHFIGKLRDKDAPGDA